MTEFAIGSRLIGRRHPTYFIADIGANHDGDLQRAIHLIQLAKDSGAEAAKFQNFRAEKIVSDRGFRSLSGRLSHQVAWKKPVFEVYQNASLAAEWTPILKQACDDAGIDYFTSPYDFDNVDIADPYVSMFKIGSGDIDWPEMIEHVARKGKPVLLATGASGLPDVQRAMTILLRHVRHLVVMQCNTNYTGSQDNFRYVNLNVLSTFARMYPEVVIGLSDHTPGHAAVLGAVALGARVVEKHFTDDNNREGPDHPFAMNPVAWRDMVLRTRELEAALGDGIKRVEANEETAAIVQRRALRATHDLPAGKVLTADDLEPLRPIPPDGIPPYRLSELVGRTLRLSLGQGHHVTWEHV